MAEKNEEHLLLEDGDDPTWNFTPCSSCGFPGSPVQFQDFSTPVFQKKQLAPNTLYKELHNQTTDDNKIKEKFNLAQDVEKRSGLLKRLITEVSLLGTMKMDTKTPYDIHQEHYHWIIQDYLHDMIQLSLLTDKCVICLITMKMKLKLGHNKKLVSEFMENLYKVLSVIDFNRTICKCATCSQDRLMLMEQTKDDKKILDGIKQNILDRLEDLNPNSSRDNVVEDLCRTISLTHPSPVEKQVDKRSVYTPPLERTVYPILAGSGTEASRFKNQSNYQYDLSIKYDTIKHYDMEYYIRHPPWMLYLDCEEEMPSPLYLCHQCGKAQAYVYGRQDSAKNAKEDDGIAIMNCCNCLKAEKRVFDKWEPMRYGYALHELALQEFLLRRGIVEPYRQYIHHVAGQDVVEVVITKGESNDHPTGANVLDIRQRQIKDGYIMLLPNDRPVDSIDALYAERKAYDMATGYIVPGVSILPGDIEPKEAPKLPYTCWVRGAKQQTAALCPAQPTISELMRWPTLETSSQNVPLYVNWKPVYLCKCCDKFTFSRESGKGICNWTTEEQTGLNPEAKLTGYASYLKLAKFLELSNLDVIRNHLFQNLSVDGKYACGLNLQSIPEENKQDGKIPLAHIVMPTLIQDMKEDQIKSLVTKHWSYQDKEEVWKMRPVNCRYCQTADIAHLEKDVFLCLDCGSTEVELTAPQTEPEDIHPQHYLMNPTPTLLKLDKPLQGNQGSYAENIILDKIPYTLPFDTVRARVDTGKNLWAYEELLDQFSPEVVANTIKLLQTAYIQRSVKILGKGHRYCPFCQSYTRFPHTCRNIKPYHWPAEVLRQHILKHKEPDFETVPEDYDLSNPVQLLIGFSEKTIQVKTPIQDEEMRTKNPIIPSRPTLEEVTQFLPLSGPYVYYKNRPIWYCTGCGEMDTSSRLDPVHSKCRNCTVSYSLVPLRLFTEETWNETKQFLYKIKNIGVQNITFTERYASAINLYDLDKGERPNMVTPIDVKHLQPNIICNKFQIGAHREENKPFTIYKHNNKEVMVGNYDNPVLRCRRCNRTEIGFLEDPDVFLCYHCQSVDIVPCYIHTPYGTPDYMSTTINQDLATGEHNDYKDMYETAQKLHRRKKKETDRKALERKTMQDTIHSLLVYISEQNKEEMPPYTSPLKLFGRCENCLQTGHTDKECTLQYWGESNFKISLYSARCEFCNSSSHKWFNCQDRQDTIEKLLRQLKRIRDTPQDNYQRIFPMDLSVLLSEDPPDDLAELYQNFTIMHMDLEQIEALGKEHKSKADIVPCSTRDFVLHEEKGIPTLYCRHFPLKKLRISFAKGKVFDQYLEYDQPKSQYKNVYKGKTWPDLKEKPKWTLWAQEVKPTQTGFKQVIRKYIDHFGDIRMEITGVPAGASVPPLLPGDETLLDPILLQMLLNQAKSNEDIESGYKSDNTLDNGNNDDLSSPRSDDSLAIPVEGEHPFDAISHYDPTSNTITELGFLTEEGNRVPFTERSITPTSPDSIRFANHKILSIKLLEPETGGLYKMVNYQSPTGDTFSYYEPIPQDKEEQYRTTFEKFKDISEDKMASESNSPSMEKRKAKMKSKPNLKLTIPTPKGFTSKLSPISESPEQKKKKTDTDSSGDDDVFFPQKEEEIVEYLQNRNKSGKIERAPWEYLFYYHLLLSAPEIIKEEVMCVINELIEKVFQQEVGVPELPTDNTEIAPFITEHKEIWDKIIPILEGFLYAGRIKSVPDLMEAFNQAFPKLYDYTIPLEPKGAEFPAINDSWLEIMSGLPMLLTGIDIDYYYYYYLLFSNEEIEEENVKIIISFVKRILKLEAGITDFPLGIHQVTKHLKTNISIWDRLIPVLKRHINIQWVRSVPNLLDDLVIAYPQHLATMPLSELTKITLSELDLEGSKLEDPLATIAKEAAENLIPAIAKVLEDETPEQLSTKYPGAFPLSPVVVKPSEVKEHPLKAILEATIPDDADKSNSKKDETENTEDCSKNAEENLIGPLKKIADNGVIFMANHKQITEKIIPIIQRTVQNLLPGQNAVKAIKQAVLHEVPQIVQLDPTIDHIDPWKQKIAQEVNRTLAANAADNVKQQCHVLHSSSEEPEDDQEERPIEQMQAGPLPPAPPLILPALRLLVRRELPMPDGSHFLIPTAGVTADGKVYPIAFESLIPSSEPSKNEELDEMLSFLKSLSEDL